MRVWISLQASFFGELFRDAGEEEKEAFLEMVGLIGKKLDEIIEGDV